MAEPVRARRLSDEEGRRLQQIVRRGKHESVRVRRAMIIMASASGTLVPAIARLVAADEDTVRDVIHAFNAKGLAALDPQWAGGRPRLISDESIEVIVTAARTRPEKLGQPFTRWSLRKLAGYLADRPQQVRIGRERLRQVLHARGISFQRTRTWKDSTVLRISEIPRCRSLEFPRGRAVRWAWDELTGLSSPGLLTGQLGNGDGLVAGGAASPGSGPGA